jgi:ribosomal-protein-alanine N-acetyltransferase
MTLSLTTDLVTLRPMEPGDRAEYVRVHELSREHFGPWMPTPRPDQTLEELFDDELLRAERGRADGTELRLVACDDEDRLAGIFALSEIVRRSFQNAYASWRVSADQVGRGVATSGVEGLLDLAFAPEPRGLGLHRAQANIIPANVASVRVAEKAGFRREGEAKRYLRIGGQWQDHLMFAKLADEHVPRFLRASGS